MFQPSTTPLTADSDSTDDNRPSRENTTINLFKNQTNPLKEQHERCLILRTYLKFDTVFHSLR